MNGDEYGVFDWWLRTRLFHWAQRLSLLGAALLVFLTYYVGPKPNWSWVVVVALTTCMWTSFSVTVVVWLRMITEGIRLELSLLERHKSPTWEGVKVIGWPGFTAFSILIRSMTILILGYISICIAYAVAYCSIQGINSSDFFTTLYFSFIAASTVGFGEVYPIGPGRLIAIFQVITGIIYTIMGIGSIVTLFSRVVTGLAPGLGVKETNGNVIIPGVFIEGENESSN